MIDLNWKVWVRIEFKNIWVQFKRIQTVKQMFFVVENLLAVQQRMGIILNEH
jgi:hypothetical protein